MKTTFLTLLALAATAFGGALDTAKEEFAAGHFEKAAAAAAAVDARDPAYARAQYLVGEIALLTGDAEAARKAFENARGAKPGAEPVLTGLGRALLVQEENAAALAVLKEAVAANPKSARAHAFFGIAQRRESLGARGAKAIDKGAKLGADDPVVARAVVLYWLDEENPQKASATAKRFRRANKKHPLGPFLAALSLERDRKYDKAIDAYLDAIALDETFLDAHKNLAILCIAQNPVYTDKKRTALAMKHFERYFALGGKDPAVKRVFETLKAFFKSRR